MITIHEHTDTGWITVQADGGTRRQRAARIGAAVRNRGLYVQVGKRYSETYGFTPRTEIVYRPV